ncbi:hypothetical protein [Butyrivibrio sp. INlla14]|uniref:hypothetical protein n=1 Tax=Butyrivibrio sp. INlla14 TaxID=1520808 RepID=UPI000876A891|nr:hypothetical protein [Butyrivibrio sp. INlla14]SCY76009.1 hypothetical protein SAMN02910371_03765 [Butyrivibrio sp. INlla14]
MESFYNELSISDVDAVGQDEAIQLIKLGIIIKEKGISACRIGKDDFWKIYRATENRKDIRDYFFSFFHMPFEPSNMEEKEDNYLLALKSLNVYSNHHS